MQYLTGTVLPTGLVSDWHMPPSITCTSCLQHTAACPFTAQATAHVLHASSFHPYLRCRKFPHSLTVYLSCPGCSMPPALCRPVLPRVPPTPKAHPSPPHALGPHPQLQLVKVDGGRTAVRVNPLAALVPGREAHGVALQEGGGDSGVQNVDDMHMLKLRQVARRGITQGWGLGIRHRRRRLELMGRR